MRWRRVTATAPREHETCFLHRSGDLYPVVGSRSRFGGESFWILEEGGPEDGEHREGPLIGGFNSAPGGWQPTHWLPLSALSTCPGHAKDENEPPTSYCDGECVEWVSEEFRRLWCDVCGVTPAIEKRTDEDGDLLLCEECREEPETCDVCGYDLDECGCEARINAELNPPPPWEMT